MDEKIKRGVNKTTEDDVVAEWKVGDVILDLYEVTGILGEGGMGRVYKVHHKGWNVDLAVKSPRPEIFTQANGKENFVNEAETWVNLGLHPHIVSCYYVRTLGGIPRVFAEYVEGGSLADWIRSRKLYEGGTEKALERILDIAVQFAWGLQYAHEQRLVHQDVKPANVMMTAGGTVKVTDFGLSKARGRAGEKYVPGSGQSIMVSVGGMTPAYCSPEQYRREQLSHKTDIWSWGVSILEMFCEGLELTACKNGGYLAAVALEGVLEAKDEGSEIPPMPEALAALLRRCFQRDPAQRPRDMLEVANELQRIYQSTTGEVYQRKPPIAVALKADGLNNRAVSFLDLGKEGNAIKSWEEALKEDPQHLEATFNLGYLRWHKGEIPDDIYVRLMQGLENSKGSEPDYLRCLAWIHAERGDLDTVDKIRKSKYWVEDEILKKAVVDEDRSIGRFLRAFEGHSQYETPVCFSPDGRYALSGSSGSEKAVGLWDIASGRELKRFESDRKRGNISSINFSPDGRYALSADNIASENGIVRLWEISSGIVMKQFEGHTSDVLSVCFSPDGSYALSGSIDRTIRLWEVRSGRELRQFIGHADSVTSTHFSPDGRYVLSSSDDRTIRLWEVASGREVKRFAGHTVGVTTVCFSPDGCYVLSGSGDLDSRQRREDNTVRLWEIATGKEIRRFAGHTDKINSVCFSPNGQYVLSGGWDYSVRLWEVESGIGLRQFEVTEIVYSVCFSPDGRYALSGGSEGIRLWEIYYPRKEWRRIHPYPLLCKAETVAKLVQERDTIRDIFKSAKIYIEGGDYQNAHVALRKGQYIPGYERDREVMGLLTLCGVKGEGKRKGLRGAWLLGSFLGHSKGVVSTCFSPDSRYALSGAMDDTMRLWEVATGREMKRFEVYFPNSVSFSPDGRYALSGGGGEGDTETLVLWEIATGREVKRFGGYTGGVWSSCFSPDGRYVLSGCNDNTVRLWEIGSGRELRRFEGHSWHVTSVCFSPDGMYVLSGSEEDGTVKLWEIASGRGQDIFKRHTDFSSNSVSFSPNGYHAGWGTAGLERGGNAVILWEIEGDRFRRLEGHTGGVNSICFSPDGCYVISGSDDKTVRLWDMVSGRELKRFEEHTYEVISVAFSPDGRYALSGSEDSTIKLWEFDWEWAF